MRKIREMVRICKYSPAKHVPKLHSDCMISTVTPSIMGTGYLRHTEKSA